MDALRTVLLVAATLSMGMMAGVFWLYANTIMPGLAKTDDRTFVRAFQAIDGAIINPVLMGWGFVGALVLSLGAAATQLGRDALPWAAGAVALYVPVMVVTVAVNVPLNDAIKAAGEPASAEAAGKVRRAFNETKWRRWNVARVMATVAATVLLAVALVVHGQEM